MNIKYFKYSVYKSDVLYVLSKKENNYCIKRIKENNSNKVIDFININNDDITIERRIYKNNIKTKCVLNNIEKDCVVNDVFEVLKECKSINGFIDLDKLLVQVKDSYINYLLSDGNLILSSENIKNNIINVILLETNSIIGEINLNEDLNINVDKYYLEDTLNLLRNYLLLYRKDKYIKILKNNSL